MMDAAFQTLFRMINWILPHAYRSVHVKDLASTMARHAQEAMATVDAGNSISPQEVSLT
jgi:hypothetical protein